ncbi:carbon storage regulator CsrA [Paenibacillus sp. GCM10027626]|uniref:carbon storage regulator CsrA n=1 Tax=Paenibacillus sp. GCM10027626 TaxID=3273411 RepID=UPI0036367B17
MLVLSRKKGEAIIIGDDIEITLLEVNSDAVKIGIKAPKEIEVLRKEIYLMVKESNQEAAAPAIELDLLNTKLQRLKEIDEEL